MHEKFNESLTIPDDTNESYIEKSANYEGNESLLLFKRLSNPIIKRQLVDFIYSVESSVGRDSSLTKEQVVSDLEVRINQERSSTHIVADISKTDFPYHSTQGIILGAVDELSGESETVKQLSITEAHEKGHNIRPFNSEHGYMYRAILSKCLDAKGFTYSDDDWQRIRVVYEKAGEEWRDDEKETLSRMYIDYLLEPHEIIERMSQLKNYFGFEGDEEFTSKHLEYARHNYVKDTGLDNLMTAFFSMITPDTENEFLRIINSVGV